MLPNYPSCFYQYFGFVENIFTLFCDQLSMSSVRDTCTLLYDLVCVVKIVITQYSLSNKHVQI